MQEVQSVSFAKTADMSVPPLGALADSDPKLKKLSEAIRESETADIRFGFRVNS